jgi:predicted urease superfamily metal-dependent hydrolase
MTGSRCATRRRLDSQAKSAKMMRCILPIDPHVVLGPHPATARIFEQSTRPSND